MAVIRNGMLVAMAVAAASAYEIPRNVQAFHNRIKDGKCAGGKVLKDGFYSEDGGAKSMRLPIGPTQKCLTPF